MNDAELRALVRDSVARHLRGAAAPGPPGISRETSADVPWARHPSHHQYVTVVNAGEACVIEPTVSCDHCGYCKSHGH